jgi:hypothetical protein
MNDKKTARINFKIDLSKANEMDNRMRNPGICIIFSFKKIEIVAVIANK